MLWEQTSEGTAKMFDNENQARNLFYDNLCFYAPSKASKEEIRKQRIRFAENYYKNIKE